MDDLAERIEAATFPDRELDCRIWAWKQGADFDTYRSVVPDFNQWQAPHYTGSIDAAMMLVPEGCLHMVRTVWSDANNPNEQTSGYASVDRYSRDDSGLWWKENFLSITATPALALAAAAIRAGAK